MIEAISGIFLDNSQVLLLQRAAHRTWNPTKWDLMGGDIQVGEKPGDVFLRDTREKLRIDIKSIQSGGVLKIVGDLVVIKRHLFICQGDYTNLELDPEKYSQFDWFNPIQTKRLELVLGVKDILDHVNFFK